MTCDDGSLGTGQLDGGKKSSLRDHDSSTEMGNEVLTMEEEAEDAEVEAVESIQTVQEMKVDE